MEYHNRSGCLTPSRSENDPRIQNFLRVFLLLPFPRKKRDINGQKVQVQLMAWHPKTMITEMATSLGILFSGSRLVFLSLYLRFVLLLTYVNTCLFSFDVWGENIKSPIPGLSELMFRQRYNRQFDPGVASCIGLCDQSHIAEAF